MLSVSARWTHSPFEPMAFGFVQLDFNGFCAKLMSTAVPPSTSHVFFRNQFCSSDRMVAAVTRNYGNVSMPPYGRIGCNVHIPCMQIRIWVEPMSARPVSTHRSPATRTYRRKCGRVSFCFPDKLYRIISNCKVKLRATIGWFSLLLISGVSRSGIPFRWKLYWPKLRWFDF